MKSLIYMFLLSVLLVSCAYKPKPLTIEEILQDKKKGEIKVVVNSLYPEKEEKIKKILKENGWDVICSNYVIFYYTPKEKIEGMGPEEIKNFLLKTREEDVCKCDYDFIYNADYYLDLDEIYNRDNYNQTDIKLILYKLKPPKERIELIKELNYISRNIQKFAEKELETSFKIVFMDTKQFQDIKWSMAILKLKEMGLLKKN